MEKYTTHIKSKTGWFEINWRELWHYRDLILLFIKRTYSTRYKQTILGPLWLVFNPLITVSLYALVFGNLAGLSTDGAPKFVFYLCSNSIWSYFATCITETSNTFTANSAILGKVYFPRLVMPVSSVVTGLLDFLIQIIIMTMIIIVYMITGITVNVNLTLFLAPALVIQTALLGLGCGVIVAACTTKYRDLAVLVSFGVQLWMYISPVVYTTDIISDKLYGIYMINPMAPIIATWRYAILGIGEVPLTYWGISWIITILIAVIGILLFGRVEKTFMDTV